jgi:hypothetical protein
MQRKRQQGQVDARHQPQREARLQREQACIAQLRPARRASHRRQPARRKYRQQQQPVAHLLHQVEPANRMQSNKREQVARALRQSA